MNKENGMNPEVKDYSVGKKINKQIAALILATNIAITGAACNANLNTETNTDAHTSDINTETSTTVDTTSETEMVTESGTVIETSPESEPTTVVELSVEMQEQLNQAPIIEGLTKQLNDEGNQVIYVFNQDNPYGVEITNNEIITAGSYKPNVEVEGVETGAVCLQSTVCEKLIEERLAQIPDGEYKTAIAISADITDVTSAIEIKNLHVDAMDGSGTITTVYISSGDEDMKLTGNYFPTTEKEKYGYYSFSNDVVTNLHAVDNDGKDYYLTGVGYSNSYIFRVDLDNNNGSSFLTILVNNNSLTRYMPDGYFGSDLKATCTYMMINLAGLNDWRESTTDDLLTTENGCPVFVAINNEDKVTGTTEVSANN